MGPVRSGRDRVQQPVVRDFRYWHLAIVRGGARGKTARARKCVRHFGIPLVDVRANFLRPIKFGDVVDMASRVSEFRRSSFDVEHRLSVNGELAVEGSETRVWASRSKDNPEKIGGTAIPGAVIARFGPA